MSAEDEEKESAVKTKGRKHRTSGFEEWGGYMAAKKMKLAAQFAGQRDIEAEDHEEIRSEIFKGISIFVNGYTKPSADELRRLMLIHGGTYHHYFSSKTTHTVASNLPYSKIKNLKNQIVVMPDWITDSIKAGKLLHHQNYLLYPPEMTHRQQRLKLENFTELAIPENETNLPKSCDDKFNSVTLPQDSSKKDYLLNDKDFRELLENNSLHNSHSFPSNFAHRSSPSKSINDKNDPITAAHPAFLSEFYSHSRLHHISTSGQELKRYVQTLVDNHGSKTFPGRENIKCLVKSGNLPTMQNNLISVPMDVSAKNSRVVMHVDMDCFFVSVGLRKHPELKGKPVAVTHSKGKRGGAQEGSDVHFEASYYRNQSKKKVQGLTSVEQNFSDDELFAEEFTEKSKISKYSKDYGSMSEVASCSYEARKAGIRNGMFLGEALRRCPDLKTIPYDFEAYSEVSKQLYDIVASFTLDIEAISCDELFIDCTELLQDTGISPLQFASILRTEIEQKTKCTASAGLGANMLLARLATKAAKPDGQYYVPNEHIEDFMVKQHVKDLPGVGYSTSSKFEHMGITTCGDLQKWSLSKLQQEFGPKTGQTFYKRCRGKDSRTVQLQKERKSVSAEINYGIRFEKDEDVFRFLKELSVEVVNRLQNINCKGKCITLKLMIRHPDAPVQTAKFMGHGVCDHVVKSVSLKSATDDALIIGHECCMLARSLKIKPEDYRGVGIQLSKLEPVQKDNRGFRSIESFVCTGANNNEPDNNNNKEIFAPKEIELIHKPLPKGGSIKDFLSEKSSPSKPPNQPFQPHALSVEQLDKSVLNALPEDLQKEVLEMYGTKTAAKSTSSVQNSGTSSHSGLSTSDKTNKLPTKKNIQMHQNKNKNAAKQNTLLDCMAPVKNHSSDDKEEESVLKKKATIGGAENINEVRSLVKEWVLSSQVVLEEDIDQFRDYLLQVIDEDLKKVDLILKYFHRVVSTANTLWQQAYLSILSYVQQKMLQKYGTMLDAKSEFST